MAKNKKSFVAYCDWQETFNALPDELAGKLIKHLFSYVNDENPETDDVVINATFANIKQALKRDLVKYENIVERNRINGSKGGRPKAKEPNGLSGNPKKPQKADSDNGSDSEEIDFSVFWNLYNKKQDTSKCQKKWNNLGVGDQRAAMEALPKYLQSTPDKQYRKNPATWLNGRCWEDEIGLSSDKDYASMDQRQLRQLDGMGNLPKEYKKLINGPVPEYAK